MDHTSKISKIYKRAETSLSKIIGERDLHPTFASKGSLNERIQVIRDLSTLSMNDRGRKEIQEIIDRKKDEYFCNRCISIMKERRIDFPDDFDGNLKRRMGVDEVKKRWGNDLADVFVYVRGIISDEKSEQLEHKREDVVSKFEQYDTKG